LHEIAEAKGIHSYHIDGPDCVGADNFVMHKLGDEVVKTQPWIDKLPVTIGITAGASTPDQVIASVIDKIFAMNIATP
jgi:4-hydroxy-3-methylbut-2-enyl diphosphate reductase